MILRTLTKDQVETEDWRVWNAFVDLLAMEDYSDLSSDQRPAHLAFWYMSEVENGGHFQYFENRGTDHLVETVEALGMLGAESHQQILREAGELWLSRPRQHPESAQEYCDIALEGEMDAFDSRFYDCSPSLDKSLEAHLRDHQSSFIRII